MFEPIVLCSQMSSQDDDAHDDDGDDDDHVAVSDAPMVTMDCEYW